MNEIKLFNNPEFGEVRAVSINNEPWFVGKDVALALGYGDGKSSTNAVSNHVDSEDISTDCRFPPRRRMHCGAASGLKAHSTRRLPGTK